ncbi:MAG: hypothetical protein M3135_02450, partial [Actinomycetota bacterium]|nr:hypothetical protein [Actinomycetota bacterium]
IFHTRGAGTDLTITGVTIRDGDLGMSGERGAGIHVEADTTLVLSDAIVTSNTSIANGGGGIFNLGAMTLQRVDVTDNVSDCCGGIWHDGGTATLTDVLVARNSATNSNDSGGIFNDATMTLERVAIIGNDAEFAGGLGGGNPGASLTATNVTISGNSATDSAGGFSSEQGAVTLNNVTITSNVSDSDGDGTGDGGGIYESQSPPEATIRNTIIAGNTDRGGEVPDCGQDMDGAFISGGHNLIGSTVGCTFTPSTGDLLNVDPMLGALADNGGFTMTHALLTGSPAIDAAGSNAAPTDQRGLPRNPDIGAYELVLCKKVPINRIGTVGNDVLTGTSGPDGFFAQDGNDKATGLGGNDAACMGAGKDTASGGGGKDTLLGEAGKDKLKGQGGKDVMKGGPGKDSCVGGGGKDKAACETERKVP